MLETTLILSLCAGVLADEPLPEPERHTFNCTADGSLWPYLEQAAPGDAAAVLVYLHGHYGDEYQGMTVGTYDDAFGRLRDECARRNWVYVCPWYGGNTWMGPIAEQGVADLIGVLRERYPGRPVYLCGGSMGGSSTLVFATRRPDLIDGAIAVCPAGDVEAYYRYVSESQDPTLQNIAAAIRIHYTADGHILADELAARSALRNAERLTMPLYLIHGAQDTVIPVDGVRGLAARLKDLGRPVLYHELPDGAHDTPVLRINWAEALDFIAEGQ